MFRLKEPPTMFCLLTLQFFGFGDPSFRQTTNPPAHSPLLDEGPLQTVRQPLEQICRFRLEGSMLSVDRRSWEGAVKDAPEPDLAEGIPFRRGRNRPTSPIEMIFQTIQDQVKAAPRGFSSGRRGAERTDRHFSGESLSGGLMQNGEAVRLTLDEEQAPHRSLELVLEEGLAFRIQMTHPTGDMILVNQTRNGRFSMVAILGDRLFAGRGETYLAFRRLYRRDAERLVSPALSSLGVAPFLSPQTPTHRRAVIALLRRTPETIAEGKKLLSDLDHESFAVRDNATKSLIERIGDFKDLIEEKSQSRSNSPEVQTRLQSILDAKSEWRSAGDAAFEILKDVDDLVAILDDATPEEIALICSRLERTTGERLGRDPVAWKEWAKKRPK